MRRIALLIEYDGTAYAGWQRQDNALTVQEVLETAAAKILGLPTTVVGSGRTDAGVHGRGQVAHLDAPLLCRIDGGSFARALNSCLPRDVRIRASAAVGERFQARFDAIRREYLYTVVLQQQHSVFHNRFAWSLRSRFDAGLVQAAADIFLGTHDFTTFSKMNASTEHYRCVIQKAAWREVESGVWQFHIIADHFVYGMVRSLVGAMVDVGNGRRTLADIGSALALCDRSQNSALAPSAGLVLWRVHYHRHNDPFAPLYEARPEDIRIV
jgi:tRNA pseudouridine38-40 synthase